MFHHCHENVFHGFFFLFVWKIVYFIDAIDPVVFAFWAIVVFVFDAFAFKAYIRSVFDIFLFKDIKDAVGLVFVIHRLPILTAISLHGIKT